MITKPMLAVAVKDLTQIKFPVLVTPKLDGIRCIKVNGKALSRKFKPIPNNYIRNLIEQNCPDGFDGEIMAGKTFNECQSLVMSQDGEPEFTYMVFDYVKDGLEKPYEARQQDLLNCLGVIPHGWLRPVYASGCPDAEALEEREAMDIALGYEGTMIRSPDGPYKCGRSTLKEGYLLKLKRFEDSEAMIIGFEELEHNQNEAKKDELGHTKRSSAKAGKVGAGKLGNLLVRDIQSKIEFSIGSGFDDELRKEIWNNQNKYKDKIVKYRYQPSGAKDKPRFPVFLGFRHEDDMS